MAMSEVTIKTVTEKYPWDIKLSPRSAFSAYRARSNEHLSSCSLSQLTFDFGFMKNVPHHWSFTVNDAGLAIRVMLGEPNSTYLVRLCELHLELISGGATQFQTQLIPSPVPQHIIQGLIGYQASWMATANWDDSIDTFRITLVISKDTKNIVSNLINTIPTPTQSSIQDNSNYKKFLFSEYLSDATIVCGGKEFRAHRFILAARSPVFEAMFGTDMEESNSGRVEITDFEPQVVEQLIKYMYTRENPDKSKVLVMQLFCVAHKYEVTGLKDFCVYVLLKNVTVDNALDMYELAVLYSVDRLKSYAFDVIKRNKKNIFGDITKYQQISAKFPNMVFELFDALG